MVDDIRGCPVYGSVKVSGGVYFISDWWQLLGLVFMASTKVSITAMYICIYATCLTLQSMATCDVEEEVQRGRYGSSLTSEIQARSLFYNHLALHVCATCLRSTHGQIMCAKYAVNYAPGFTTY